MTGELGQGVRARCLLEVVMRGDDEFAAIHQPPCDQRGVLEHAHADGDVEALVDQFHRTVGEVHLHFQLRVQQLEVVDQRRDVALAEGGGAGQLEHAAGAGMEVTDGLFGGAEAIEEVMAVLEIHLSGIGETRLTGGAVEQLGIELGFQLADQTTDM